MLVGVGAVPVVMSKKRVGFPYFVDAQSSSGLGDRTVAVPTGTLDGHCMIAAWSAADTTTTLTLSGWNLINTETIGGTQQIKYFWRIALSEPANYLFDASSSVGQSAAIVTIADTHAFNPIDGTPSTNTAASTTATATTITTTNPNTMLVMIVHANGTRSYSASTLSERVDTSKASGTPNPTLGMFTDIQVAPGASGSKVATISSSATYRAILLGIRPRNGV